MREYYSLTNHAERSRKIYAAQLKLGLDFCTGKPCQFDLDRAINTAVDDALAKREKTDIALIAQRLREEDIQAAIAFARSPAAQSILAAENGMEDQAAALAHATTRAAYAGISARFCPSHRDICIAHGLVTATAGDPSK